jgi:hypothetical protein
MTGPAYPEFRRQATGNREAIVGKAGHEDFMKNAGGGHFCIVS